MATNALTAFQPGQVPAHVAAYSEVLGENTTTVPSLSPQGKVWTISIDGQKTKLEKRDTDGEVVPVTVMKVVILDYAKRRGRTFYEGAYDPDKESAPICWSDDGITPDATVPTSKRPRPASSATPARKAAKGSKVTDQGKAIAACSQHRMLAVVPANKLDFAPLRLKIAITSDWDKQSLGCRSAGLVRVLELHRLPQGQGRAAHGGGGHQDEVRRQRGLPEDLLRGSSAGSSRLSSRRWRR
jgi:hypothetical protein